MFRLFKVAPFVLAALPAAQAQLHLIAGNYNQGWNERYGSAMFEVSKDGTVSKTLDLASQEEGFFWIGISYESKVAAVVVPGQPASVVFLSLANAEVAKRCEFPLSHGVGWDRWLADVPGLGSTLEVMYLGEDILHDPRELYAMRAEPGIACEESFEKAAPQQLRYLTASGIAGVGDFRMRDGFDASADPGGNMLKRLGTGIDIALGPRLPAELRTKNSQYLFVAANNSQILVASRADQPRFVVLRKRDNTWRVLPEDLSPSIVRAFGKYVTMTEAHLKKAVAAQLKEHPGMVNVDKTVKEQELSAGRDEWRSVRSEMGPSLLGSFAGSTEVFPGRLHIFDAETGNVSTITTNQGDSEILLIEAGVVYYRASDRLYTRPISDKGLGEARLVATDEAIRDVHWAFLTH